MVLRNSSPNKQDPACPENITWRLLTFAYEEEELSSRKILGITYLIIIYIASQMAVKKKKKARSA